jgi:hypothetical protein
MLEHKAEEFKSSEMPGRIVNWMVHDRQPEGFAGGRTIRPAVGD